MSNDIKKILESIGGFDWDGGNKDKNWRKHRVTTQEAEQVFYNRPRKTLRDNKHSQNEERFMTLGKTTAGRALTVFFTIRDQKIRIISARDQKRGKEKKLFNKREEN